MTEPLEKRPRQARGHARVDRLLDAAAMLIAQHGVDGVTMAAVGEAAGSAPGTLYQFFSNRTALVQALARRESAALEVCVDAALSGWTRSSAHNAASLIDALLPPLLAFYRARPAWGELLHALSRHGVPGAMELALDAAITTRLADALSTIQPRASPIVRMLCARVLLDLGHAGLLLAGDCDDPAFREVRCCLTAYITVWAKSNS